MTVSAAPGLTVGRKKTGCFRCRCRCCSPAFPNQVHPAAVVTSDTEEERMAEDSAGNAMANATENSKVPTKTRSKDARNAEDGGETEGTAALRADCGGGAGCGGGSGCRGKKPVGAAAGNRPSVPPHIAPRLESTLRAKMPKVGAGFSSREGVRWLPWSRASSCVRGGGIALSPPARRPGNLYHRAQRQYQRAVRGQVCTNPRVGNSPKNLHNMHIFTDREINFGLIGRCRTAVGVDGNAAGSDRTVQPSGSTVVHLHPPPATNTLTR